MIFVGSITINLDPPLSRSFPSNENSVTLVNIERILGVFLYVFNHLKNLKSWVNLVLKVILKNSFVPPHQHLQTHHHKNCSPLSICRGDFRRSSYWLALTHKFLIHHRALIFPRERGKSSK